MITNLLLAAPSVNNKSVRRAFNRSLTNLGLDYLDMYLINFPGYAKQNPKGALNKKRREETWLAIVKLYDEGKVNAVGVSNFTLKHLRELTDVMAIGPMVNQVKQMYLRFVIIFFFVHIIK